MNTGYSQNEYGTWQSEHVCDTCGQEFTVTPAAGANMDQERRWGSCLAFECDSYDASRDADILFAGGMGSLVKHQEKEKT